MTVDRHALAILAITGSSMDMVGALYLAYDLLGGLHGPLRTVTRGVTYGLLFGAGFAIAMGPAFGLAAGAAHGLSLAWEFGRASRGRFDNALWRDIVASGIRALGFGIGAGWLFGPVFGATFGGLSLLGQAVAYRFGLRPTMDYRPAARLRITKWQLLSAVNRTIGYGVAGYISSAVSHHAQGAALAIRSGLAIGAVTAVSTLFMPMIEWWADHVPEKRMAVFGVVLIAVGFLLQSAQYWTVVLDWTVR
jgi:hypothetical protein